MTQIIFMLFEDKSQPQGSPERYQVEIHFSPGVKTQMETNMASLPPYLTKNISVETNWKPQMFLKRKSHDLPCQIHPQQSSCSPPATKKLLDSLSDSSEEILAVPSAIKTDADSKTVWNGDASEAVDQPSLLLQQAKVGCEEKCSNVFQNQSSSAVEKLVLTPCVQTSRGKTLPLMVHTSKSAPLFTNLSTISEKLETGLKRWGSIDKLQETTITLDETQDRGIEVRFLSLTHDKV